MWWMGWLWGWSERAPDEEAFAQLFAQYHRLVYKTAYLMLGDAAEAEDALQEVFLKVHRALGRYDSRKAALSTWLHRITVNHCLNVRRRRRVVLVPLDDIATPASGAASAYERIGDADAMMRALDRLSEKLRTAVILRYYLDLSHEEMARTLGVPVGTVKSRIAAALTALRRTFENDEPELAAVRPLSEGGRAR